MKKFTLNDEIYCFEYNPKAKRKVKISQQAFSKDLYGRQKQLIVEKLYEMISSNPQIDIPKSAKQYIIDYHNGRNKNASHTTNSLGKILYTLL